MYIFIYYLKLNGLSFYNYYSGWLLTLYFEGLLIIIIITTAFYFSVFEIDFFSLTINLFLYITAISHQTLALSTLFDSPKIAGEVGGFIQIIPVFLFYLKIFHLSNDQHTLINLICLFP